MPTSVHLPEDLLREIDKRAHELGISRNRYITDALQKAISTETDWSSAFVRTLAEAAADTPSHGDVDAILDAVKKNRTRKPAPQL